MSDWQVGDPVVCVDGRNSTVTEGAIYTVAACFHHPARNDLGGFSEYTLLLREIAPPPFRYGFCETRFRKIRPDEHEACEDEFVELLNRSKQPEKLPMVEALARFGDVPTSFVMREMMFERDYRELERWVAGRCRSGPGSHASHSKPAAFRPSGFDPISQGEKE
jgi:hypothetical protein